MYTPALSDVKTAFRCTPALRGTPLNGLYEYMMPQRVGFFRRFGHK